MPHALQIRAEVETPATDARLSDRIHPPDLGERPDDQAVLQYAMGRWHIAMRHDRALTDSTEPDPIRELFDDLANEETKRKAELAKIHDEIARAGGVCVRLAF